MARQLAGNMVALDGLSDLSKHLPGGLIGDSNLVLQLVSRDPDLEETNGAYPLRDRRPCLLEDSARGLRELIFTVSTLVFIAIFSSELPDKIMATTRTLYTVRPANIIKKLAAFILISKIIPIVVKPHRGLLCLESAFPSIQVVPLGG